MTVSDMKQRARELTPHDLGFRFKIGESVLFEGASSIQLGRIRACCLCVRTYDSSDQPLTLWSYHIEALPGGEWCLGLDELSVWPLSELESLSKKMNIPWWTKVLAKWKDGAEASAEGT